ncbi:MAG: carbohydrate binding family 9 domain-containing protein [Candidatus Zixiibacteriota bacterium]|nr:MAG: carbohydrate binding family 9 domain-containing protein [candidate division Zixibacteria bacterium]
MNKTRRAAALAALCVPLMLPSFAVASSLEEAYTPVYSPQLTVETVRGKITIDGDLGDSGWSGAARANNFAEHQPGDQTRPPVDTEALITYDADNLYVAFICHDDPSAVRASFCQRDGSLFADDNICLLIDTYGDAAWAYELNVNPYGIQADALWSKLGGEDGSYDLIWESAGKITDSGYQIEMAVPFSSLRFPDQQKQVWKMDFWRNHPRDVRGQYSWAAYDRDEPCWPCQWGTVTGIENVKPGRGIEIIPTFVGYQSGMLTDSNDPSTFDNDDPDGEFSINGKYAVSSDVTAELTYNPDFSQVEADAAQVDVNTNFALFYSERRPFFQEGSDLFKTIFDAVYTRSVNDPDFAAKVTARKDRTSVAYMVAHDENSPIILPGEESSEILLAGKSTSNILRARRTFGENSNAGILLTDRRFEGGGSGTLLSADGAVYLSQQYRIEWQAIGTYTAEPEDSVLTFDEDDPSFHNSTFDDGRYTSGFNGESFWGNAYYFGANRETRNSYIDLGYLERSPTYRSANGFQPMNNQRSVQFYSQYVFRFDDGLFQRIIPTMTILQKWNFAGETKKRSIDFGLEPSLRLAQTSMHLRYARNLERWAGIDFENVWILHACLHSYPGQRFAFGGSINYSHLVAQSEDPPIMGKETYLSAWFDIKPIDRLYIENWYTYVKGDALDEDRRLYEGYIARTRWSLQLTRALAVRLVGQYDDFRKSYDLDPLVTYQISPFSVFYIGSTYDYSTFNDLGEDGLSRETHLASRQFFMKLQYLFQI